MAAMVEVALCGIGPDEQLPRVDRPDEFAADEIRGALSWTRSAADGQLRLAWDLIDRLAPVFASLDRGVIDVPKARVFSEWTVGLTDDQALEICDRLLPEAPELTTGQLIDRVKRTAIALDPEWSRRRYEDAVRERKVVGYRNEDGTGNVCGYQLPVDRAAAACANIDALAKKIKQVGDRRPIDHVKADLYLGMLDGSYAGWTESDIIAHVREAAATDAADRHDAVGGDNSAEDGRHSVARRGSRPRGHNGAAGSDDQATSGPDAQASALVHGPNGPVRRVGVEIRAEITTLLGLDDHPAEIPGWGHVHADVARSLVADQTGAEWRFAITDDDGRLVHEGITRHRPRGNPSRADAPVRGGIVELQISLSALRHLAARPVRLGGWAKVITDLTRQADQHEKADDREQSDRHADQHEQAGRHERDPERSRNDADRPRDRTAARDRPSRGLGENGERGPRSPGKPMRRRTEIRDRTCTHPRCRAPAHGTDGDHIQEWARGGATSDVNIGSACRHDHRLRHEGGWTVIQPRPGHLIWTSRLGIRYDVRPPLIIQQLPDPIPRASGYRRQAPYQDSDQNESADQHDPAGEEDCPTWREPSKPRPAIEPHPTPEPDLAGQIPPF